MQIQISWLLQKPTDLDLHCLQRQSISGFSRTSVNPQVQFKMIADDIQKYCHVLEKTRLDISTEFSMYFLQKKKSSAAILIGALRVNVKHQQSS